MDEGFSGLTYYSKYLLRLVHRSRSYPGEPHDWRSVSTYLDPSSVSRSCRPEGPKEAFALVNLGTWGVAATIEEAASNLSPKPPVQVSPVMQLWCQNCLIWVPNRHFPGSMLGLKTRPALICVQIFRLSIRLPDCGDRCLSCLSVPTLNEQDDAPFVYACCAAQGSDPDCILQIQHLHSSTGLPTANRHCCYTRSSCCVPAGPAGSRHRQTGDSASIRAHRTTVCPSQGCCQAFPGLTVIDCFFTPAFGISSRSWPVCAVVCTLGATLEHMFCNS
jgi:hypothetical protein